MIQWITRICVAVYVVVCIGALAWWSPHFFSANAQMKPSLEYAYLAGSGLPYGLLILSIIALQSLLPKFSFLLATEFVIASTLIWCVKTSFYYPPQANFFCPVSVWACVGFLVCNLIAIQRTVKKQKAAAKTV